MPVLPAWPSARRRGWWPLTPALGLAALWLAGCSLAGDVTPPPNATPLFQATPTVEGQANVTATPSMPDVGYPLSAPSAAEGGALYLNHCAACHGPTGAGDGEMAAQLTTQPPDFSDPAFARARSPRDLYTVITDGRIDNLMPPFGDSLSEAERWSLAAFVYTLSTPPEQLAAGQAVYAANCAACHGDGGQGDGPQATGLDPAPPDFTDPAALIGQTGQAWFALASGGDAQHPFAALPEADRWAALAAVRAFAYAYADPADLLLERPGTVIGHIVNQTGGSLVPPGLTVNLHSFEGQTLLGTLTTTAAADGAFSFPAVPYRPGRQFIVTSAYQNVTYGSEVGRFNAHGDPLALTLPIYDQTTDPGGLVVEELHMFLEFNSAGELTVGQLFVFGNTGDLTFAATRDHPLHFSLPPGATSLDVQNAVIDQDYYLTADGFAALWQVPPGSNAGQILFSYRLPYTGRLAFNQVLDYPVTTANLLLSDFGVRLSGPGLVDQGPQNFQGQPFQNYIGTGLPAGQALAFDLEGAAGTGATTPPGLSSSETANLSIGLGALALVLLGAGFYLYRRPARPDRAATRDSLLDALAQLDDAYAAGEVAAADYAAERAELKAALQRVWKTKQA